MIINKDYSLSVKEFENNVGIWTLSGTYTPDNTRKACDCVDEWRCGNKFIKSSRIKLQEAELAKRIWKVNQ